MIGLHIGAAVAVAVLSLRLHDRRVLLLAFILAARAASLMRGCWDLWADIADAALLGTVLLLAYLLTRERGTLSKEPS